MTKARWLISTIGSISVLALLGVAHGQQAGPQASSALFPFEISAGQAPSGTAVDMSFLNASPAGAHGRIVALNGHFAEASTGAPIRFVGVNIVGGFLFPTHDDADRISAHLSGMGINLVRCHLEDQDESPLWDRSESGHSKLDQAALDRFDYFVSQLKRRGIYVDLNLHSGLRYTQADGFPASVESLLDRYGHPVDLFDATMIERQKRFAKDYLTHVNPCTGMSYVHDPCVAMIECNNENSLATWDSNPFGQFASLPEPFLSELKAEWNRWLARKYVADENLRTSWSRSTAGPGERSDSLVAGIPWTLEDVTGRAAMTPISAGATALSGVRVDVPIRAEAAWHVQAKLDGLTLRDNRTYVLTFQAKSDAPRAIGVAATIDKDDWHGIGLSRLLSLNPEWRPYRLVFTTNGSIANGDRLLFVVGDVVGSVWIRDVNLVAAAAADILQPGETLSTSSVPVPDGGPAAVQSDWHDFLIALDARYASQMRDYLRDDLGIRSCMIDSQSEYGGLSGLAREASSDYIDNHAYIDHPENVTDAANWRIANKPLVGDLAASDYTTPRYLACSRVAGKPYSVSEFNHPAPGDYQSDTIPFLATFAALQDWDSIVWFAYDHGATTMNGFFDMRGNPAKEAFFPAAAAMFRMHEFPPAAASALLTVSRDDLKSFDNPESLWRRFGTADNPDVFSHRFAVSLAASAEPTGLTVGASNDPGSRSVASLLRTPSGPIYSAVSTGAIALTGYLGGQTVTCGAATITAASFGGNFASLTLTTLDGKPLADSKRLLLVVVGRAAKAGMVWNSDRSSLGRNWGNGPALAEGVPATVSLANGTVRHVWALGPDGTRETSLPLTLGSGKATFETKPDYHTVWYELTAD